MQIIDDKVYFSPSPITSESMLRLRELEAEAVCQLYAMDRYVIVEGQLARAFPLGRGIEASIHPQDMVSQAAILVGEALVPEIAEHCGLISQWTNLAVQQYLKPRKDVVYGGIMLSVPDDWSVCW